MEDKEAKVLLNKYKSGSSTEVEKALLESWYLQKAGQDSPILTDIEILMAEDEMWQNLVLKNKQGVALRNKKLPARSLWPKIAAAGVLLIAGLTGIFFYYTSTDLKTVRQEVYKNDVGPGSDKAILILADGSRVSLTDAANGSIAEEEGISITKTKDGQLVYMVNKAHSIPSESQTLKYNTIETPRGGQYQVLLPDGTRVWLNAQSSLKFPAKFSKYERRVELTGEGYFEVFKKNQPFVVQTTTQQVMVLGTHFNINSYADERETKTTLLEGKVKVMKTVKDVQSTITPKNNNSVMLSPGQQAILNQQSLNVLHVDADLSVDWKNGEFSFKNESLQSILRKVSRWYNVDVIYQDVQIGQRKFSGTVSRFENVSKVLKILGLTGDVHFKLEGKNITVTD